MPILVNWGKLEEPEKREKVILEFTFTREKWIFIGFQELSVLESLIPKFKVSTGP